MQELSAPRASLPLQVLNPHFPESTGFIYCCTFRTVALVCIGVLPYRLARYSRRHCLAESFCTMPVAMYPYL
jgi:hypothetical protein